MKHILFLLITTLFFETAAFGDNSAELARLLIDAFHPEELTLVVAKPVPDDGFVEALYVRAKGAKQNGLRIADLQLQAFGLQLPPKNEWNSTTKPNLTQNYRCNLSFRLNQVDVERYLNGKKFRDGLVDNVTAKFHRDKLTLTARVHPDFGFFSPNMKLSLDCAFEVKNGAQIWLKPINLSINGYKPPLFFVNTLLNRVQPLLDLNRHDLPVKLGPVKLADGYMEGATLFHPKAIEGDVYYYNGTVLTGPTK